MRLSAHKTLIATGAVTILFFIVVLTLIAPSMKEIRHLNSEIVSRRVQLERLYKRGQSIRRVSDDLERIAPSLPRLDRAFLHLGEELDFITTIETLANKNKLSHDLEFLTNQQDKNAQKAATQTIPITIALTGSYKNIYRYLVDLDALPYSVTVSTLTLVTGDQDTFLRMGGKSMAPFEEGRQESDQLISAQIEALTYWREK